METDKQYISSLARNYPTSGIRAMFDLASGYPEAINLCNGEPDFDTPKHICDRAIEAINAGMTKYGTEPGLPAMRDAVAKKYSDEMGLQYDIDNVMVTIGGVEGILLCLMTIINSGDEVIIPDPTYTCYVGQTLTLGGVPVRVPLYEENKFRLQPEDLEKAITSKTKVLILSYPSNPLGAVLAREDGEKLAAIIKKHNLIVISDEVYEKIIFDGRKHFSMAEIPSIREQVLVVNSLSKTYAMTGWRLGYVVGLNKEIMRHMFKMQQAVASCLPVFIMQAGAEAIQGPQDCVDMMREEYQKRRDLLVYGLNEIPGMRCFKTEGSFCTFINIEDFGVSSWEFSKDLLINAGVMTVAGSAFGSMGEGYLRVCFANSQNNIYKALESLYRHLK